MNLFYPSGQINVHFVKPIHLLFLLLTLSGCSREPVLPPGSYELEQLTLGISFPPVSDEKQREFTAPILEDLAVTKIRFAEEWANREPEKGTFNWGPLDERIAWAEEHDLEILLTIQSNGPDWACSDVRSERSCVFEDNDEFRVYVETLLQRYPNRISRLQFGNEWQTEWWYAGTAEEFTASSNIVYDAIQQYSPETEFVLGGFTTASLRILSACEGLIDSVFDDEGNIYGPDFFEGYCDSTEFQEGLQRVEYILQEARHDFVDIHLYDDPENWEFLYQAVSSKVNRPIIVTEFGGPNLNLEPRSQSYQAEQVAKYIRAIDSLGIQDAYFFRLVEGSANPAHETSALITSPGLREKDSYWVFRAFSNPD